MKTLRTLLRVIFYGMIAAAFVVFSLANRSLLTLSFSPLPVELSLPKYLFGLLMFLVGVLLAGGITGIRYFRLWFLLEKAEKRVKALENEVASLYAEAQLQAQAANEDPV